MNFDKQLGLIRLALFRAEMDVDLPERCLTHLDQAKRELDNLSIEVYQKSRLSGIPYPVTVKEES